jgi:glycine cleavage system P protein (glycine dehydrogenase)
MTYEPYDAFELRHIGPRGEDVGRMLAVVGASSLDALVDEVVPPGIRSSLPLNLPVGLSEHDFLQALSRIAGKNRVRKSYIGLGYYDTITPPVILRNVMENPGWYTPYTPYQAEIAQGRLESLLNFQTMVTDLTGMEVANASLLDEPTAAAEAMTLLHRVQPKRHAARNTFLVSSRTWPQTRAVIESRAEPLGIDVRVVDPARIELDETVFGLLLQYPDERGAVEPLAALIARAHDAGVLVAVATDLLALTLLSPPGEAGADVVVGNSQRFGVPLGYGGPHAAFFATREAYVRQMPGRIIGVSVDSSGRPAYRMALQTREQHIRREKATSNICTAQALLANMAAMYAVYHGPSGLKAIATQIRTRAVSLEHALKALGYRQLNATYFDTLQIDLRGVPGVNRATLEEPAVDAGMNFRWIDGVTITISLDETVGLDDIEAIAGVFSRVTEKVAGRAARVVPVPIVDAPPLPQDLARSTAFLQHAVFNRHHSETEMMRYIKALERKDIGLDTSMIPLGSCTMKLNAAAEMMPVTWEAFSRIHPFAPANQAAGYAEIFHDLEQALAEITGLAAVSLQPNSGAQGELAGLLVIRAWHRSRGEARRDVVLIPASAHGTNPASAVMAGMKVVVVATDPRGYVDVADLKAKAEAHRDDLAALMVTYPSTHGVYEESIRDICAIVHEHGGQVYMDGANMNAQVGLTSPAAIGADVCHLNLHKTFAIPHGGGGPGMGPIAVAGHLAPFLPGHPLARTGGEQAIAAVAGAPWGSASILLISYAYIRLLGAQGVTNATRFAILNANYIKSRLERHYDVLYTNARGRVAHEMIFDLRAFKSAGVDETDVAKRLMDYGFHAPTVSFPVPGTLMIEPTESEPLEELDRFCDAMIAIRAEIEAVATGKTDPKDNLLKNAPHTAAVVTDDEWSHPYSRREAAFPLPWVQDKKVWPAVGRIDNPYGDRNLMCVCPPVEEYAEETPART